MKLKISLANVEETQCVKNEESVIIDRLLSSLLDGKYLFPKRCIRRTSEVNIVEIGDFEACDAKKLIQPEVYAKTLLNLTFGINYVLEEVQ